MSNGGESEHRWQVLVVPGAGPLRYSSVATSAIVRREARVESISMLSQPNLLSGTMRRTAFLPGFRAPHVRFTPHSARRRQKNHHLHYHRSVRRAQGFVRDGRVGQDAGRERRVSRCFREVRRIQQSVRGWLPVWIQQAGTGGQRRVKQQQRFAGGCWGFAAAEPAKS